MDLIKELRKQNELDEKLMQEHLKEAKSLIANDESREREVMSYLGIDKNIRKVELKQSSYSQKQQLVSRYGTDVFHEDQLRKICVAYNLRFLNTQFFQGWVDTEAGSKIRSFVDKNQVSNDELEKNFFIMAPTSQFKIHEIEKTPTNYDPLLFYKIDNEHYLLVHQWGKELNWMRYIFAFPKRSFFHSQIHFAVITFAIIMATLGLFNLTSVFTAIVLGLGLSLIITFMRYRYATNDFDKDINEGFTINLWNTNIKIK